MSRRLPLKMQRKRASRILSVLPDACLKLSASAARKSFLPDVRAMSHAIEVHVAEHWQKSKAPAGAAAEAERVRDALITQVLSTASKSENDGP